MANVGIETMNIREVEPNDDLWPQMAELFSRAVAWLADPADDGDYRFFAATDDTGTFLGGSVIDLGTLLFGPLADVPAGFLEDIEVLEPHRRNGVGAALLRAALNCAWQTGCESVRSTVAYDATAAIALYRNQGFGFVPEEDPDADEPDRTYSIVAINPQRVQDGYGRQQPGGGYPPEAGGILT